MRVLKSKTVLKTEKEKKMKKMFILGMTVLILSILVTACGGDDDNTGGAHEHSWSAERQNDVRPGVNAKTCTYNGCDELSDIELTLSIGDNGPAGGKIFYVADGLEKRTLGFTVTGAGSFTAYYLEAAPYNQGTSLAWASSDYTTTDIAGTGTAIGTGKENTRLILAIDANAPAAKACADYRNGGKSDWFLPSRGELNEMCEARNHIGILTGYFWSSSQVDSNSARLLYWYSAGISSTVGGSHTSKDKNNTARPVRAF